MLLPYIVLAGTAVAVMLMIAFFRHHGAIAMTASAGLAAAFALVCMLFALPGLQRQITPLIVIDRYSLFFTGLIILAGLAVAGLSHSYFDRQAVHREEFYVLLLIATLGAAALTASSHFVSFFLGIETLTVSLYGLAAYLRDRERSIEAGVKYLILAAVSSAVILFGMALVYAETGVMQFPAIAARLADADVHRLPLLAGLGLIVAGMGFKLAVVPFHLWTPDVYEGAPAPVTAFVATASKGAVFAVLLRLFLTVDLRGNGAMPVIFTIIAIASMFTGNLLALLQDNVKRILAYSSISHLGYLLVAFLAGGPLAMSAAAFYLASYFVTTLGAFGVVSMLSTSGRDADALEDYRGLAWRRPWLAGIFTVMLLSLAGMPLTAGFIGKFYIVAAGIDSSLWLPVVVLIANSAIGLFYYLRVVTALYSGAGEAAAGPALSIAGGGVLSVMTLALIWLGVYPGPVIDLIRTAIEGLM